MTETITSPIRRWLAGNGDETRPQLDEPFPITLGGERYVAATNGSVAVAMKSDEEATVNESVAMIVERCFSLVPDSVHSLPVEPFTAWCGEPYYGPAYDHEEGWCFLCDQRRTQVFGTWVDSNLIAKLLDWFGPLTPTLEVGRVQTADSGPGLLLIAPEWRAIVMGLRDPQHWERSTFAPSWPEDWEWRRARDKGTP